MINDSRLCPLICLLIFLVTRSLFKRLALLVIDLAISVPRHYRTLLAVMSVLNGLWYTVSQLRIAPIAHMSRLEVEHLLILVGCGDNVGGFSIPAILKYDIAAMAAGPWLNNAALLH